MSYSIEKSTGDLVISGFEQGIAASPHKGIANIQNGNIATETGEVMASFGRFQQSQVPMTGTFTQINSTTVQVSSPTPSTAVLTVGTWVTITSNGISGLALNSTYYVSSGNVGNNLRYNFATAFTNNNTINAVSGLGSGSCTFTIYAPLSVPAGSLGLPVASATETYTDSANTQQARYYIMTQDGYVWVRDSSTLSVSNIVQPSWFLPDIQPFSTTTYKATGLAVLNGFIFQFIGNNIYAKSTVNLGDTFKPFYPAASIPGATSNASAPHTAFVGHNGYLIYTDGNFIGKIFPNIGNDTNYTAGVNIQSFCSYTAVTTTGTVSTIIGGSLPTVNNSTTRIPVVLFCDDLTGSSIPSAITAEKQYWLKMTDIIGRQFEIYAAATGGSALDIATGAVGAQYFNTFYPISKAASQFGGTTTLQFTPQRLNLPFFEISQCFAELGTVMLIGCKGNVVYNWDQVSALPNDFINIPENNVVKMVTVNNMGYLFAGSKGNIYITNGSSASIVVSVPDYCAGIPGTQASYIEPYFTWGDATYLRGRVYFSILDQTATKAGNCGGVWSFTPTQNFYIGQDTGLALRLENQNSYGTYNGVATVLLNNQNQTAISPQYFSAWYSSLSSPSYGIDSTATTPVGATVIETDLIPTGNLLGKQKQTFQNIEYKLSNPLTATETVSIAYRRNSTEAYTAPNQVVQESTTNIAGVFFVNFEKTQWLQLQITLTPVATSSSSFVRLTEVRVR